MVSRPDSASLELKVTATSALFHPLALARGKRVPLMVGAVASRLMVTLAEAMPPAEVAEQVKVTPAVSEVTFWFPQPVVVTADSASVTAQDTVTSDTYQPLLPSVPLTVGVTMGGVESAGGRGTLPRN